MSATTSNALDPTTPKAPEASSSVSRTGRLRKRVKKLAIEWSLHHPRRLAFFLSLITFNVLLPLRAIGWFNSKSGFIHSLFLCYPASTRFSKHYLFDFLIERLKWRTVIYGVFFQGGKFGLLMTTTTTEREFTRRSNAGKLEKLRESVSDLQERLGVSKVSFAGVLPHYMARDRADVDLGEASANVARLLCDAYDDVSRSESLNKVPAIVLGGMGAIGTELIKLLNERGIETHCVDRRQEGDAWPSHLQGQRCMLIDVARKGARADYVHRFWSEIVYLNETYPEPRGRDLAQLKHVGMSVYHIVGVTGKALPAFPYAYRGGLPCCAMHKAETAKVMVTELS